MNETAPPDDIFDIYEPAILPSFWPLVLAVVAAVVFLGIIVFCLVYFLRKDSQHAKALIDPRRNAQAQLDAAAAESGRLAPNEFGLRISNTLKDYLLKRYDDPLRFETTQEFFNRLSREESSHLPMAKRRELVAFLQLCDELKYAGLREAENRKQELIQHARTIIREKPPTHHAPLG